MAEYHGRKFESSYVLNIEGEALKTNISKLILKKELVNLNKDNLKIVVGETVEDLCISLHARIASFPKEKIEHHLKFPMTWWDHFKERFFPPWAKRRFPVKYDRIDIEEQKYKLCPHVGVSMIDDHLMWTLRRFDG